MRPERIKGLCILEGLEVVEGLGRLEHPERLERQSWAFGCFFLVFDLKKNRNTKVNLTNLHFVPALNPLPDICLVRICLELIVVRKRERE